MMCPENNCQLLDQKERSDVVCDVCGSPLRLCMITSDITYWELPEGDIEINAARMAESQTPHHNEKQVTVWDVECTQDYWHCTGWVVGANGCIKRVVEEDMDSA